MKYCTKCGTELMDESIICPKCGCPTEIFYKHHATIKQESGIKTAIKVFLILACVLSGLCIFPLCWTIPMTVIYFSKADSNTPVGTGFKICTLLFVSLIAGILMLVDNDN